MGGRVRVLRPRAPFDATVIRVNQTSITVRQDSGKRWRVKLTYPMAVLKVGDGGTRVTLGALHPSATPRGGRRGSSSRASSGAPTGGSVPQRGKAAFAWMKARAAALPRDGKHFMDKGGGSGFSGWIWASVGRQKNIILSTNGEHSMASIAKLEAEIRKAIPGASTWISYD